MGSGGVGDCCGGRWADVQCGHWAAGTLKKSARAKDVGRDSTSRCTAARLLYRWRIRIKSGTGGRAQKRWIFPGDGPRMD